MIYIVGAGPGDPELLTVKGSRLLQQADAVVWAGSLVNPALLALTKPSCCRCDSSHMTLEEIIAVMTEYNRAGKICVRLQTGDPCLYGALREQTEALDKIHEAYEIVPGVSSFCGAAASLRAEYTVPGISQSVIITRMEGRTPVPEAERIKSLASHGCTMAVFLSAGMIDALVSELISGGAYTDRTPAAVVYKATWPDEKIIRGTLGTVAQLAAENAIEKTALILVGEFLGAAYEKSRLYAADFSTGCRKARNAVSDKNGADLTAVHGENHG